MTSPHASHRDSPPLDAQHMRGPLIGMMAGALIDKPALWSIAKLFMPLSRLWAAAEIAGTDAEAFRAETGVPTSAVARHALAAASAARLRLAEHNEAWAEAFFGGRDRAESTLAEIETRRLRASQLYQLRRARFAPLLIGRRVPQVKYEIPDEAEVEAAYGAFAAEPWRAFMPPDPPPRIEESRRFRKSGRVEYWLRFAAPTPRIGGQAWARVHEPAGARHPPTLLFGNGVMVEFDHLARPNGDIATLVNNGIRMIEIESPWHGRRRETGRYAGEPLLGRAPLGGFDLFAAQVQEQAILAHLARSAGSRTVGFAGISMGALAAMLAADRARHWPAAMRPDALALITFSGRMDELLQKSRLATDTGVTAAMARAGWTTEKLMRWRGFASVEGVPELPPERMLAVLGQRDEITPFAWGAEQVRRWRLPRENVFVAPGGHFSTPLSMLGSTGALMRRLIAILHDT